MINRNAGERKEHFFVISSEGRKSSVDNLTADKM